MRRSKNAFVVLWIAFVCALAAAACSINSQPVPPGAQATVGDDASSGFGGSGDANDASAPPKGGDAGVTGSPPDGGDAGEIDGGEDAGDGGEDAGDASDAG